MRSEEEEAMLPLLVEAETLVLELLLLVFTVLPSFSVFTSVLTSDFAALPFSLGSPDSFLTAAFAAEAAFLASPPVDKLTVQSNFLFFNNQSINKYKTVCMLTSFYDTLKDR